MLNNVCIYIHVFLFCLSKVKILLLFIDIPVFLADIFFKTICVLFIQLFAFLLNHIGLFCPSPSLDLIKLCCTEFFMLLKYFKFLCIA